MPFFELLVVTLMIALNSIFAAYEIALASVGLGRLQTLADEKVAGAAAAARMKQRMEASLAVVQLGITLVGATAAATSGAGAGDFLEPILEKAGLSPALSQFLAIVLVVAPLTVVTIILGELVPKVFALRNKEWVCLKLSPPMQWFSYTVWPAVWFLETVVSSIMNFGKKGDELAAAAAADQAAMQELHGAAALARMSRMIGHREEGIIVSASQLAATPLRKIMIPAEYIGMLNTHQSLSDALITAHQEMHTRFPITEEAGNPQRIIGYVNFKDIVSAIRMAPRDPSVKNLVRSIRIFPPGESVANALECLIRERNHIALLKEADGTVVGMITLEDIVEEIVGEIHDEYDRVPAHLNAAGQGWIAGGFVPLSKIQEVAGIELSSLGDKPTYTLSDWICEYLERTPRGGDEIELDSVRIVVRKIRHLIVQEAFIERIEQKEQSEPPEDHDDR